MNEKRRSNRLSITLPVSFYTPDVKSGVSLAATLNISGQGICLLTKERLELDQEMAIIVDLPDGRQPRMFVQVVRVEESKKLEDIGGIREYRIAFKIKEPLQGDEMEFIRFYAEQLKETFGKRNRTARNISLNISLTVCASCGRMKPVYIHKEILGCLEISCFCHLVQRLSVKPLFLTS